MSVLEKIKIALANADNELIHFIEFPESQAYCACSFEQDTIKFHFRKAKITPKKEGQFVVFWKRIPSGVIAPFEESDDFNFLIIEAESESDLGYFIFPKSVLIAKKIVSTHLKEGKRAFRVYPPWSIPKNKQGLITQSWQRDHFVSEISPKNFV